jgi:hypothetical protein
VRSSTRTWFGEKIFSDLYHLNVASHENSLTVNSNQIKNTPYPNEIKEKAEFQKTRDGMNFTLLKGENENRHELHQGTTGALRYNW